jgi:hypothetical protein
MNDEKDFGFKDDQINKATSDAAKEGKREFGKIFKDAIKKNEGGIPVYTDTAAVPPTPAPITPSTSTPTSTPTPTPKPGLEPGQETNQAPLTPTNTDPLKKQYDPILKTLQTYERDIADAMRSKDAKVSVSTITIAKQKKEQEIQKQNPQKITPTKASTKKTDRVARGGITLFVSVILILAGLSIAGFIYYFAANRPDPVVPATPELIATESTQTLDVSGLDSKTIQARVIAIANQNQNLSYGKLSQVKLIEGVGENKLPISPQNFFTRVAVGAPATLARAISNDSTDWIFGFQRVSQNFGSTTVTAAPFILSTVSSFDSAFEGMLRWEANLPENLSPLFVVDEIKFSLPANKSFEDRIIRNKDTRVLRDNSGNIILIYSFLDPRHLLITTNEQTFGEVLNRFFSSQVVR